MFYAIRHLIALTKIRRTVLTAIENGSAVYDKEQYALLVSSDNTLSVDGLLKKEMGGTITVFFPQNYASYPGIFIKTYHFGCNQVCFCEVPLKESDFQRIHAYIESKKYMSNIK